MVAEQSTWQRLSPWSLHRDETLRAIAAYLAQPETQEQLEHCEQNRQYPRSIRADLHRLGVHKFFADSCPQAQRSCAPSTVTVAHISALNQTVAAVNTSLAITVAVNPLALLPVYIGASAEQLEWVFERVRAGAYSSILLTELAHGSNLLRNQTRAEAGHLDATNLFKPMDAPAQSEPTHYRLSGRKDLINGGRQHDLLTVFARTSEPTDAGRRANAFAARSDFSLFITERDGTVDSPQRWHTLPAAAADISSVQFTDTLVPSRQRIGRQGNGLMLIQKTLAVSRGGISALAAGLASRALALSRTYAQTRDIYGQPILRLTAIADHVLHMQALELLIAAMSVKAVSTLNRCGFRAAHYAGVAKVACCLLAEELVNEGRLVHGGRALLLETPYHRLIGDVLLYATFDGTIHVVLEQIQAHLAQLAAAHLRTGATDGQKSDGQTSLDEMMTIYATPPQPLIQVTRQRSKPLALSPVAYLHALEQLDGSVSLGPLCQLAAALFRFVAHCQAREIWERDQGVRFEAAALLANLETLIATVELADPIRRAALGIATPFTGSTALLLYAYGWFGGRIATTMRTLMRRTGMEDFAELDEVERTLGELYWQNRDKIHQPSHEY